jgi:hypothetical protein
MHQTGVTKKGLRVKERAEEKCEGPDSQVWERCSDLRDPEV